MENRRSIETYKYIPTWQPCLLAVARHTATAASPSGGKAMVVSPSSRNMMCGHGSLSASPSSGSVKSSHSSFSCWCWKDRGEADKDRGVVGALDMERNLVHVG